MKLKHSRFNHVVKSPGDNVWALYNFSTGRHVMLDFMSYGLYISAPDHPDTTFVRSLEKAGFLTRGDEMEALRHATNLTCYGNRTLMLTICPTMGCNFACPYCFEEHRGGRMSRQTQDALVEFVKKQLDRYGLKKMCVVWFGGEPLLQPETIASLAPRLFALADERGVKYTSNIVTNAYLLSRENAEMLRKSRVTGLQITLDGPNAKTHDALRMLHSGEGSFDRILDNLKALPEGFEVKIRCNVGPHNIQMLPAMQQLVQQLDESGASRFFLVPGIMDMDVAKAPDSHKKVPESAGFRAVNRALYELGVVDYDSIGASMPGHFHGTFCGSQCAHTYVIDEDGDLYRCWEDCGDKSAAFGNVADFDSLTFGMNPKATAYLESAWCGDDPECSVCPILPLCMGACPHRHMVSGKRRCPWFKDDLDAYVLRLIDKKNNSQ